MEPVSIDLPSDIHAVLTQLLEESERAVATGECETARRAVGTVRTVSRTKLPDGELRAQLLHGSNRVHTALRTDTEPNSELVAEYLRAMLRRLEERD